MRLKPLLICSLITQLAFAQTPAGNAPAKAFDMTKATVEFLATDKKTYGYQAKESCPTCVSYETLKQFIQTNKLTKADELVNDAQKKTLELVAQKKPDAEVLKELRSFLLNRVTVGAERAHRLKLKSYAAYQNQLNELAGLPQLAMAQVPTTDTPVSDQENQEVAPDTVLAGAEDELPTSSKSTEIDFFSMSGFALLLSLLSLGGVVFLYMQKKKPQDTSLTDNKLSELGTRVRELEANRKTLVDRIDRLEKALGRAVQAASQPTPPPVSSPPPVRQDVQNRPVQNTPRTQEPYRPPVQPVSNPVPERNPYTAQPASQAPPQGQQAAHQTPAPQPAPKTERFARTADLGDGFSTGGLLPVAERGTIYLISVEGNLATYRVVENSESQQLALSDPYSYLSDACEYQNQPRPGARIVTEQPGRLSLQGEKWKIEQKAKIAFM